MKRTHMCGHLKLENTGQTCVLMGWVHKRRDHGNLVFINLRDYTGVVQAVISSDSPHEVQSMAHEIRRENVVVLEGNIVPRAEGMANPDMSTGEIEVTVTAMHILSRADTPPFDIDDDAVIEETLRLTYRFLDLRRPCMQEILRFRHKLGLAISNNLDQQGFVEIDTPILTKSTPEGARDFLVPSRIHNGNFYALPQSPQLFKQILMVSGFDRYFQIVHCFRDEDLRADRQPEFIQLDMEMSFVEEKDVMDICEELLARLFKQMLGLDIARPFQRMPYQEAMELYGSDKPDLRFDLRLSDITDLARECSFSLWKNCVSQGGVIKALKVPGAGKQFSRKEIEKIGELAVKHGAKGMFWLKKTTDGLSSSFAKKLSEEEINKFLQELQVKPDDLVLVVADDFKKACDSLGALRLHLANKLGLIPAEPFALESVNTDLYRFLWVVDFPLLDYSEEDGRYYAQHHPFTSPIVEDLELLESDPGACRARAYDLVLNGVEIAGGSIRIHVGALQKQMFSLLGITEQEAESRFGFLLSAFRYGVPPHGGIAFGMDRLLMAMRNISAIRDLIAFPKTTTASCLMTQAPSSVTDDQLKELGLKLR